MAKWAEEALLLKEIKTKLKACFPELSNLDEKWLEHSYVAQVTGLLLDQIAKRAKTFASQASNEELVTAWQVLENTKGLVDITTPIKGQQTF